MGLLGRGLLRGHASEVVAVELWLHHLGRGLRLGLLGWHSSLLLGGFDLVLLLVEHGLEVDVGLLLLWLDKHLLGRRLLLRNQSLLTTRLASSLLLSHKVEHLLLLAHRRLLSLGLLLLAGVLRLGLLLLLLLLCGCHQVGGRLLLADHCVMGHEASRSRLDSRGKKARRGLARQ